MRIHHVTALALLLGAAFPAAAQEEATQVARSSNKAGAEFVTGVEYQEGNYFTGEQIETLSIQNVVRVQSGRANFAVSVPWHRIEAPGNVVGGGGILGLPIIVDPTRPATRTRRSGIGDLRIGAGYSLPSLAGFDLTLTGQVKLPTASRTRGIGTGETDVSVGGELARTIGAVTPFVAVSYTVPGDPQDYELRNSLSARGGVAVQLAPGVRGNVSYGYAQSLSPLVPDEEQVSSGINVALDRSLSLGVFGSAGLSDGSADVGAGVSLGFRIF